MLHNNNGTQLYWEMSRLEGSAQGGMVAPVCPTQTVIASSANSLSWKSSITVVDY